MAAFPADSLCQASVGCCLENRLDVTDVISVSFQVRQNLGFSTSTSLSTRKGASSQPRHPTQRQPGDLLPTTLTSQVLPDLLLTPRREHI